MSGINDLPADDIWPIIFSNLSINDLFSCRLVNKQFKYFSDNTNSIYKLIIGQLYSEYVNDYYWYYNNKLIDDKDIISLECFRLIKLKSIFNLDKNLKYLKIYDHQLELKELSNLINLEAIEFGYNDNDNQQIINLNSLKCFISDRNQSIKLNTPKLEKIKFNEMINIELDNNQESIKHLIASYYDYRFEIFKNLEIIELRNADQSIDENLLIIFKYLKQLKIDLSFDSDYSNEQITNILIKILNDKIKLRRKIDIYLEGIKIENIDKLNELKANEYPFWKFKLNNYDLLDLNLSSIYYLNYKELEQCVNNIKNDLPITFFDKFQNINQVDIISVNNVDNLNWFLNNLKCLKKLTIYQGLLLGQVFYNNLPYTIRHLDIYNIRENINFDFILKLTGLVRFETFLDKNLFDLAFESFSNLKYLNHFKFEFKYKRITIEKNGKDFYLNGDEKLDYNQLIIECNKIRSK